jgi:hypothetical protein
VVSGYAFQNPFSGSRTGFFMGATPLASMTDRAAGARAAARRARIAGHPVRDSESEDQR